MKKLYTLAINYLFSSRMKSLYWRTGGMFGAFALDILLQDLVEWNPSSAITIFAGLIIGEITKKLNSK